MRQIYLFLLSAILALGATFQAKAYTATFEWDEPGTVVFSTSFGTPFTNDGPATTSYVYNGTSTVYVKAADGYYLKSITRTSTGDDKAMTCTTNASYGRYGMVSFSAITTNSNYPNDGATFKVEVEKIVYDGTLTINLVNASQFVTAKLGGTNRALTLKTGPNTIAFAKGIETNISFEIASGLFNWTGTNDEKEEQYNQMVEAGNLYIKKNGEPVSGFSMFYGSLRLPSNIAIADGDVFEAKFTDMVDEVADNAKVTLNFEDEGAKTAFSKSQIFNVTAGKRVTIGADNTFEIEKGNSIRFSVDNQDYIVTMKQNNTEIPSTSWVTSGNFNTYTTTINDNTTFTLSSKEREYGKVTFQFYANGIEGLVFHYGDPYGPVIDSSEFTYLKDWSGYISGFQRSYKQYSVQVSAKTPKIFFETKDGWYLDPNSSFCAVGGSTSDKNLLDATIINEANVTYLDCKEIKNDSKFIVYVHGFDPNMKMKDINGKVYPLAEGYNEFDFDPNYTNGNTSGDKYGFSISQTYEDMDADEADALRAKVFQNDKALILDDYSVYSKIKLADKDVIRIHSTELPKHVITVSVTDKTTKITYDKVREYEPNSAQTFSAYEGAEISILPRKDSQVIVDGDAMALEPGMPYVFNVETDHKIEIKYVGIANIPELTPDQGETVKEFNGVLVSFPEAQSVKFVGKTDEVIFSTPDERWAVPGIDPLKIEAVDAKTFKISFKNADLQLPGTGDFCYFIPEGAFEIDGDIYNNDIRATFTYEKDMESVPYVCAPWDPTPASNQDIAVTIGFCEYTMSPWGPDITVMYNISGYDAKKANTVGVTFNGEPIEYNQSLPEDGKAYFQISIEGCMFMVNTVGLANKGGKLVVTIPAGLFKVNGKDVPQVIAEFEYIGEKKEFTHSVSAPEDKHIEPIKDDDGNVTGFKTNDISKITLVFEGVENAEVFNDYGVRMKTKGSYAYSGVGSIVKRGAASAASYTTRAEGSTHTFDVTFANAPKTNGEYELTIAPETFTLDGQAYPEEQILHNYVLDIASGVITITADGNETVTVLSIDGKVLLKDAERSALNTLEPGLYIINGKKKVVK